LALESQLTERDRAGERQSAEIQEARARSESLDAQIVSMRSELDGLRQTVTEKETLANRAADNLDAANKTIADFRSQMAELEAKCKTEVEADGFMHSATLLLHQYTLMDEYLID
uniref:Chromosome segregation protein SMC n=1 Tax=Schistocephalus solidus TaxID=70667 RepID=A0A183TT55_SCHSO